MSKPNANYLTFSAHHQLQVCHLQPRESPALVASFLISNSLFHHNKHGGSGDRHLPRGRLESSDRRVPRGSVHLHKGLVISLCGTCFHAAACLLPLALCFRVGTMVREMKANLESPKLVGSSLQITPQPAAKVSLLHLQSFVEKTTLLRVIPLLPDGSSPRESPGIRALGIPVVAGRNRTSSQTPVGQRKLSEITLDGAEYGAPNEVAPNDNDELKQGKDELPSPVSGSELFSPEVLLGNQKGKLGMPGDFSGNITMDMSSDDEDIFCTPLKGLGPDGIHNPPDFQLRYRKSNNGSLVSDVAMSYSRDTDGRFKPAAICRSDKPLLPVEKSDYERRSRVFSISSMQRDLSPMTQKTFKRIVELDAPTKDIHFGGQDGAMEGSEVVLRSSEVTAKSAAAAKENSSVNSDDGIPVEGEMVKQLTPEAGESGYFESDKIRMRIERDTLFICFPGNIRGDAVGMFISSLPLFRLIFPIVIEIMLEVKPLYLEGKPYVTFIFAGLPYCGNGAYINFRIDDENDWKFNTFPEISTFETEGSQENKLCGILDLARNLHPTAVNRSLIIRALRRLVVLEVLDFRMKTNVTASFSWSPIGDRITSQFEINIIFLDLKLDNDASHSMINFYLVNGPETQDDMTVDSPEGIPPQFVFGDLDFETLEVSVRRCKLLRIERPMRDTRQPLRIRFNKQLGFNLKETGIPSVRVRGEAVLVEESIFIVKPRLPLEVVFSPNSTSWKKMDRPAAGVSTKFTRTGISMREASPSVFISCLNPVMSSAGEEIGLALATEDGFIDRINYEIEESESFSDRETSAVALRMSFGIYIPAGLGPMGEIVRIHVGSFGFSFATINDRLAGKGVLFEDGDELLVLNREIAKGDKDKDERKERLLINTEWFGEQGLEISCGEMEFRLPRVMARVVGRTDFECGNRQGRLLFWG